MADVKELDRLRAGEWKAMIDRVSYPIPAAKPVILLRAHAASPRHDRCRSECGVKHHH
jgi:hypothetical protein